MNTFSHPEKIVEDLPIFSGQKVADFGAGKGTYSFLLAQKVKSSPEGMVFAIEIQKPLVDYIAQEAKEKGLTNIKAVWGDVDDPGGSRLRDESVQVVLVANTLFQVEKRSELIREAKRVLTKKGMLIVIDWSESFGNIGPHKDQVVTQHAAQVLLEEHGFEIERNFNAGEHHYGIITYKN
jgi:ubiquinone/menaquinone biosynthesis C-methylase UbiE